jgi:hypothetical protein
VAIASDPCPATFLATSEDHCGFGVAHLFEAGRQINSGDTVYARVPGAGCVAQLADATPAYELGVEIPLEELQLVTREEVAAKGQIAAMVLFAEGRALQFDGWRDVRGDFDCAPEPATDSVLRCLPFSGATPSGFSDAACTSSAAVGIACPLPKFAISRMGADGCHPQFEIRTLGSPVQTFHDRGSDGACHVETLTAGLQAFAVGEVVAPARFAEATPPSVTQAPDRLAVSAWVVDGVMGNAQVNDTTFGVNCSPARAADGVLRCIPQVPLAYQYFADAACSRVVLARLQGPSCTSGAMVRYLDNECPRRTHVVAVGPAYAGDVFQGPGGDSTCTGADELKASFSFNVIRDELAPNRFLEMTLDVQQP